LLVDGFLAESAQQFADKPGLITAQGRFSYAWLERSVAGLAAGLRALGAASGDRVVVHLENSVEAVVAIFGAMRAGCVLVPINPTVKPEKLSFILNDCAATVLISDQPAAIVAETARAASPLKAIVLTKPGAEVTWPASVRVALFTTLLAEYDGQHVDRGVIDIDLAALIYTSGSTGRAKGVMLTHGNIVTAATSISSYLGITSSDVILDALPLSFDYGLYQLFLTAKTGATTVLERAFVYPTVVLNLIDAHRVTGLPIVPMMAALLLRQDLSAFELSSLRFISNTGAVLSPVQVSALRTKLPHVSIFKMYGLTECKRVSYLDPAEIDRRPDSVGKPMDNVEVFLVDESGCRKETGIGELVVRGSNVMQGYWGAPEATDEVLKPAALPGERELHTGDIFRIDDEGFMYFLSRSDDVIKCRGQKVSPKEVEMVLLTLNGIQEVFVMGVPDPLAGEAVKAFVTLDAGVVLSQQDVQMHCTKHLEDFMVPKFIDIVTALPRTTSGKVSRASLQSPTAPDTRTH
jgi:acyl-CoA synthetase (AMP-forming)/AMP-acid ligase II